MSNTILNGLILSGGRSSRMGSDKGLLQYHGMPQREFLFRLLTPYCNKVFVSCKSIDDVPSHLNPLPDFYEIESPLNGILTAFQTYPDCVWLVVAIDMPFIDSVSIDYLLQQRKSKKVATCFYDSDGQWPEPLFSVWEPEANPLVADFYKSGNISPRDFLRQHDVNIIPAPDRKILRNINTPEDFEGFNLVDKSV